MDLFITCGQGIEPLLVQELIELGYPQAVPGFRGVYLRQCSFEAIYQINYQSRLASRVLLPLLHFPCRDPRSLYQAASKINWTMYISPGKTIAIDANVSHKQLRHSLFAAQVVKDAICDQLRAKGGWRPTVDVKNPDVQLNLFIHQEKGTLSFDTSGKPLHKRGYRQECVEAPVQESLAAALLMIAGYQQEDILCDPCCGSGTILIEAALKAAQIAPGFLRTQWGFFHLPEYSQIDWLKVKNAADGKRQTLAKGRFFGADNSKQAVHATKVNLRAAGLHQFVEVVQCDIREYVPAAAPTLIITNPPYGRRLDDERLLAPLYRAIGDFMKRMSSKPGHGFVLTGSPDLAKEVGLAASRRHVIDNGGIDSRLLEFPLYTN